jgi:uncharacterized protein (DUF1786 family)
MSHSPSIKDSGEVLALDIGGGTQDLLLWSPNRSMENSIQCVLPSPTVMAAREIDRITEQRQSLFIEGLLMGGGASSQAVRRHLKAGLAAAAQAKAARTLHDNLEYVKALGVVISEDPPPGSTAVIFSDIRERTWRDFFEAFGLDRPRYYLVAVQDHGYSPVESNRKFRFDHWREFLEREQPLESLLLQEIPPYLTRMQAIRESWPAALVMDTGAAAILGALEHEGLNDGMPPNCLVVNIGNEHTLAAWLVEGELKGIYEHHTFFLNREKLLGHLEAFVLGRITNRQIFEDQGHGCLNHGPVQDFPATFLVTGPRRAMLVGSRAVMAAPHGNMMLSGCFGLLRAFRHREALSGIPGSGPARNSSPGPV